MDTHTLQDPAVKIRWAAYKNTSGGWSDIRRNTSVHSLYWIRAGSGRFESERGCYEAQRGELLYLEPGLSMKMAALGGRDLHMAMVLFDAAELSDADGRWPAPARIPRFDLPHRSEWDGERAIELDTAIGRIIERWTLGTPVAEREAGAALLDLLDRLHTGNAPEPGKARALFERGLTLLGQRFAEPLTTGQLAGELHVSVSHLRKLFVHHAGVTPKQMLSRLRLRQAERYLLYTDLTLHAIAGSCGYGDEFHFSRTFKKHKGLSPSAFRRRAKEDGPPDPDV
ncbi:helix-turn-helix transcriptional regulator [Saccharibacillus brassicae]|uniref:AraC family transcriptional regulator n=1 Tax=Saccharibacillus brassicae TaxID=2583377 RepID=A0A4Y6UZE7_SACBS|nr:AraC family transcriptional regulator [Saccharibacillus brassicae]QDH23132.1 AraC family transcriptional regulator [Saccharibacillus brassicae]